MTDPYQPPQTDVTSNEANPHSSVSQAGRHGCLTAYLILMMVANAATSVIYLVSKESIQEASPLLPDWAFPVLIVFGLFNFACAIAIFRWKKWGFWGFLGSSLSILVVNFSIGVSPGQALSGLVGVAILYGVLQIGGEKKGWSQLH